MLREAFEAAADGLNEWENPPVDPVVVAWVRTALTEAEAGSMPGLPVVLRLKSTEALFVLQACWEFGAETGPRVTDDQLATIGALIEQATQAA